MLGWDKGGQVSKAKGINPGDRIAIKRMLGKGKTGIRIMHLGIVKGVVPETSKVTCTVDWVATKVNRLVSESKGCFQSVHGPYVLSDPNYKEWLEEIFCL